MAKDTDQNIKSKCMLSNASLTFNARYEPYLFHEMNNLIIVYDSDDFPNSFIFEHFYLNGYSLIFSIVISLALLKNFMTSSHILSNASLLRCPS